MYDEEKTDGAFFLPFGICIFSPFLTIYVHKQQTRVDKLTKKIAINWLCHFMTKKMFIVLYLVFNAVIIKQCLALASQSFN